MKKKIALLLLWTFTLCAESPFTPHSKNHSQKAPYKLSISAHFCNEAKFLKEWLEFHLLVGVEHFYLFNYGSEDKYLRVLEPYIKKGIVELFDYPSNKVLDTFPPHQNFVLHHCNTEWLAFCDTKEFFTPIGVENLQELLLPDLDGIYLLWHVFGTAHVYRLNLNELLIERLKKRAPAIDYVNRFGRMIVRPNKCKKVLNKHFCIFEEGALAKTLPVEIARINHYFVRTEDYFKKMHVFHFGENPFLNESKRELQKYMPRANSVEDFTMEVFVEDVKKRMNIQ